MLASGYARIQPGHSGARCEPPERHPQRPCVAHAATRASTLARESAPPRAARLPSRPHGAHTRRPLLSREEASLPGVAFLRYRIPSAKHWMREIMDHVHDFTVKYKITPAPLKSYP